MRYPVALLEEGSGFILNDVKAGEDLKTKKLVYIDNTGRWKYADRDSLLTLPVAGITLQAMKKGLKGPVLVGWGIVGDPNWFWTVGGSLYASSTPGEIIETRAGEHSQKIGYALEPKKIVFNITPLLYNPAGFIYSSPPTGGKKITNIWWDPDTQEIVTDHQ